MILTIALAPPSQGAPITDALDALASLYSLTRPAFDHWRLGARSADVLDLEFLGVNLAHDASDGDLIRDWRRALPLAICEGCGSLNLTPTSGELDYLYRRAQLSLPMRLQRNLEALTMTGAKLYALSTGPRARDSNRIIDISTGYLYSGYRVAMARPRPALLARCRDGQADEVDNTDALEQSLVDAALRELSDPLRMGRDRWLVGDRVLSSAELRAGAEGRAADKSDRSNARRSGFLTPYLQLGLR